MHCSHDLNCSCDRLPATFFCSVASMLTRTVRCPCASACHRYLAGFRCCQACTILLPSQLSSTSFPAPVLCICVATLAVLLLGCHSASL